MLNKPSQKTSLHFLTDETIEDHQSNHHNGKSKTETLTGRKRKSRIPLRPKISQIGTSTTQDHVSQDVCLQSECKNATNDTNTSSTSIFNIHPPQENTLILLSRKHEQLNTQTINNIPFKIDASFQQHPFPQNYMISGDFNPYYDSGYFGLDSFQSFQNQYSRRSPLVSPSKNAGLYKQKSFPLTTNNGIWESMESNNNHLKESFDTQIEESFEFGDHFCNTNSRRTIPKIEDIAEASKTENDNTGSKDWVQSLNFMKYEVKNASKSKKGKIIFLKECL